jgi:hypothetical protein
MPQEQEAARGKEEISGSATTARLGKNRYAVLPYRVLLFDAC